ncbi:MAG: 2-hydroxyacyl-CoA dehydratase, partial [Thermoleophilia bacterium]|nr:2-hydroxyacyl-CoA dehydratase [Thermoleophilia bacterium]
LSAQLPAGAARPTTSPAPESSAAAEPGTGPALDYPVTPQHGGVFVVAGPLTDDSLLRLIGQLGAHVSGLESCTSPDRWRALAAGTTPAGSAADTAPAEDAAPADHAALAAHLLEVGMCPRRSTTDRRDYLARRLDLARPSSVIYARQSFCDPGAYDALLVAQLAKERGLPYLEIEVDFPFDANGPLRTRVEAFLEAQLLDDDLLGDLDDDDLFGDGAGDLDGARE